MEAAAIAIRTGVIVEGGHLRGPWALPSSDVMDINGSLFFCVSKCDRSLAACLGLPLSQRSPWDGNGFIEYLLDLRNAKVLALMRTLVLANDPNGDGEVRRRGDIADDMPQTIQVDVPATDEYDARTLVMRACTRAQAKLWLELTPDLLTWLLHAVHSGPPQKKRRRRPNGMSSVGDFAPAVKEVTCKDSTVLLIHYTDAAGATHTRSRRIPSMTDFELMVKCRAEIASGLQIFYDANHHRAEQAIA